MNMHLVAIAGLATSFAVPAFAQQKETVDPEVRQHIETAVLNYQETCNNHDVAAAAALFTPDAVEVVRSEMADAGSFASGREAIERRCAAHFASSPSKSSLKLVQAYAIGREVCGSRNAIIVSALGRATKQRSMSVRPMTGRAP